MTRVGILALQGCIDPHIYHFTKIGVEAVPVRSPEELQGISGIVLPGGESTTMLKLLRVNRMFEQLRQFVSVHPTWGICAGSILLAKEVTHPNQESLRSASVKAERNSYGSQRESFKADIQITGMSQPMTVDFIRAPRLFPLNARVEVLARYEDDAVLLRDGNILCSSFHSELGEDSSLHQFFAHEFLPWREVA